MVGEVIAHELAHAVVPPEYDQRAVIDFSGERPRGDVDQEPSRAGRA
jgi:hypothetical protein